MATSSGKIIIEGREAGEFDFEDVSVTNQLMFMTLNSPIFLVSAKDRRDPGRPRGSGAESRHLRPCAALAEGNRNAMTSSNPENESRHDGAA